MSPVFYKSVINKIFYHSKTIGTYLLASLIPMVLSMVINPWVAKNLSPEDYAIIGYYTSYNTLIGPLITFYMLSYYMRNYYMYNDEDRVKLKATVFKSLIWFSGLLAFVAFGLIIVYTVFFNKGSEIPLFPYLILSVFALPLTGVYSLMLAEYKISRRSRSYFNLSVVFGLVSVAFTIVFVIVEKWGAFGKLFSVFLLNLVFFIGVCWYNRSLFRIKYDWKLFKKILKFCYPLTLAAMLGFFSNGYDRVYLEKLGDLTELGYYVVGSQIAGYLQVFSTSISSTFQPDIYQSVAKKNYKRAFLFSGVIVGIVAVVVVVFILLAPYLIDILTAGRYMMSVGYARIIAVSLITSVMYFSLSEITVALGKTRITFINKVITTVVTIGMYAVLIPAFGFDGAAWGMSLSFVVAFVSNALLLLVYKKRKSNVGHL